jgi:hypothetical protein
VRGPVHPSSSSFFVPCQMNRTEPTKLGRRRRFGGLLRPKSTRIALGSVWGLRDCLDRTSAHALSVDSSCLFILSLNVLFRKALIKNISGVAHSHTHAACAQQLLNNTTLFKVTEQRVGRAAPGDDWTVGAHDRWTYAQLAATSEQQLTAAPALKTTEGLK